MQAAVPAPKNLIPAEGIIMSVGLTTIFTSGFSTQMEKFALNAIRFWVKYPTVEKLVSQRATEIYWDVVHTCKKL